MITVYQTLSKTCQVSFINEPHNLYKNTNCQCQIETLKTLELDHTGDVEQAHLLIRLCRLLGN